MYGQPSRLIELVQRGMASQQAGMIDAAEALYRQALAIDANQFEALHFLGVLQAQVIEQLAGAGSRPASGIFHDHQ